MTAESFRLTQKRHGLEPGTILYPYHGHDYGISHEDTMGTGQIHRSLTEDPAGVNTPFYSLPITILEKL